MSNTAIDYLSDKIDELSQQCKRYESALEYLLKQANNQLKSEEDNLEAELLALEIVKVYKDTSDYKFKL